MASLVYIGERLVKQTHEYNFRQLILTYHSKLIKQSRAGEKIFELFLSSPSETNPFIMRRAVCRGFRTYAHLRCEKKASAKELLENAATYEDAQPATAEDEWYTLPYAEGSLIRRGQGARALRPNVDPKNTSIILFPGQGAQFVGMAKDLLKFPGARDIFELANEVLNYDLLKLCLQGPKNDLDQTIHCQPAVMVTSLAALERLREERPMAIDNCVATAGFSLGEITALVFAGAIPFDRALKLVQVRAEAMQQASTQYPGGMATVLYGPDSELGTLCKKAEQWCLDKGVENPQCIVANYLYPHCKVIAGNLEALKYVEANYKQFNVRRVKTLPVSGAFHTELMASAVEPFSRALRKIKIEDPIIPVHSNVDGKRYKNASHILRQLPKQIVRPVKWEQTLHVLYERKVDTDFPRTFECGPGRGLTTILKQVNAKAWDSAMNIEV